MQKRESSCSWKKWGMQLTRIFVESRIEMGIPFLCFSGYTTGEVVGGNGRVLTYIFKKHLPNLWVALPYAWINFLQNLWKFLSVMVLAIRVVTSIDSNLNFISLGWWKGAMDSLTGLRFVSSATVLSQQHGRFESGLLQKISCLQFITTPLSNRC